MAGTNTGCEGQMKKRMARVYQGKNLVNGKVYVGSTVKEAVVRFKTHKWNLERRKHCNKHLQNAWNKHGPDNFEWTVLEECAADVRLKREQWWISHLRSSDPKYGYNILHTVRTQVPSKRRSAMSKEMWLRPGLKERIGDFSREKWNNPEYKAKMTQTSLEQWKDPKRKKRHQDRLEKLWSDPKMTAALEERNKKRWDDPKERKKHSDHIKACWEDPTYREQQDKIMRDRWDDPRYQAKISDRRKEMWKDPEYRAKISAIRKAFWAEWRIKNGKAPRKEIV